jgi:hypothetical protein
MARTFLTFGDVAGRLDVLFINAPDATAKATASPS